MALSTTLPTALNRQIITFSTEQGSYYSQKIKCNSFAPYQTATMAVNPLWVKKPKTTVEKKLESEPLIHLQKELEDLAFNLLLFICGDDFDPKDFSWETYRSSIAKFEFYEEVLSSLIEKKFTLAQLRKPDELVLKLDNGTYERLIMQLLKIDLPTSNFDCSDNYLAYRKREERFVVNFAKFLLNQNSEPQEKDIGLGLDLLESTLSYENHLEIFEIVANFLKTFSSMDETSLEGITIDAREEPARVLINISREFIKVSGLQTKSNQGLDA